MTRVYFVRHAQPEHEWEEDRTRPLTEEGKKDSAIVLEFLKDKKIDAFYCSPYKRSMDTIAEAADFFTKEIITDERLRELNADEIIRQQCMAREEYNRYEKMMARKLAEANEQLAGARKDAEEAKERAGTRQMIERSGSFQ